MQSRVTLINSNENWNSKRRYKINEVKSHFGSIYQNSTGTNSDPLLGLDWQVVKKLDITPIVYHDDFVADISQQFTVPEGILIQNVYLNSVSATGSSWSQTGLIVTVTSSLVGDLVTLTGRN
jgi:hypothetical protein